MDAEIRQVTVALADVQRKIQIANSEGDLAEEEQIRVRMMVNAIASRDGMIQTGYESAGGAIGLVQNGDRIRIDIPNRSINVLVSDEELTRRRALQDAQGWKPANPRPRKVSAALKAYAKLVTSADKGAVRDLSLLD